jgi:hypothetical protein
MINAAHTATVTLTVYRVEADLVDITSVSDTQPVYVLGYCTAYAQGNGIQHQWTVPPGDRVFPGDTVTVDISPTRQPGQ